MFTQSDNAIPVPFFIVLTFWLVVIFASFSLFAEPNRLVIASILVFAISVSSALFLIVDLSHPFERVDADFEPPSARGTAEGRVEPSLSRPTAGHYALRQKSRSGAKRLDEQIRL